MEMGIMRQNRRALHGEKQDEMNDGRKEREVASKRRI
jgi:hypothetical protein